MRRKQERKGEEAFIYLKEVQANPPSIFALFFFDASSRKKITLSQETSIHQEKTKIQNILLRKRFSFCRKLNNAKANNLL